MGKTLFDKLWERHVVLEEGEAQLLYIDLHLIHEVTSPQLFEGLRGQAGRRRVRCPEKTLQRWTTSAPTKDILRSRIWLQRNR